MSWISNTAIDNSLGFQIMVIMEYERTALSHLPND